MSNFIPTIETLSLATAEAGMALGRGNPVVGVDFHVLFAEDSLVACAQFDDVAAEYGRQLGDLLHRWAKIRYASTRGDDPGRPTQYDADYRQAMRDSGADPS